MMRLLAPIMGARFLLVLGLIGFVLHFVGGAFDILGAQLADLTATR